MSRTGPELAEVFRRHGAAFREKYAQVLPLSVRRVMRDIASCRTAALGGHVDRCDRCSRQVVSYNSCRNRHCPKCLGSQRKKWLEARESELLPVPYFHVVFTVPQRIAEIALRNRRIIYDILFRVASETLLSIARDPNRLGARIGFFAVLHTWTRTLLHHPHLHCVVPGGGLSLDGKRWIASRRKFFLPVRVLSRRFRNLFVDALQEAFRDERLRLTGPLESLADPAVFHALLDTFRASEWVVYSKRPFGGPERAVRYLGRYTHRVALVNDNILHVDDRTVTYRFKNTREGHRIETMTLDADEFIRRFLLHVLPERFVKIRHFGLLANRCRKQSLALCRRYLAASSPPRPPHPSHYAPACPACGGRMLTLFLFAPGATPCCSPAPPLDSS